MDFRNVEMSFGSATLRRPVTTDLGSGLRSGTRQDQVATSRIAATQYRGPFNTFKPFNRFAPFKVEIEESTWPKLALLYWICREKHNYRAQTTLVFVIG